MKNDTGDGTNEVIVTLRLQFKPGAIDAALEEIIPIAELTRAEPGNDEFHVFRARHDRDQLIIFERWKDQFALEQHWQKDYTKAVLAIFDRDLVTPFSERTDVTYLHDVLPASD